jgi:hypothetical protein
VGKGEDLVNKRFEKIIMEEEKNVVRRLSDWRG